MSAILMNGLTEHHWQRMDVMKPCKVYLGKLNIIHKRSLEEKPLYRPALLISPRAGGV